MGRSVEPDAVSVAPDCARKWTGPGRSGSPRSAGQKGGRKIAGPSSRLRTAAAVLVVAAAALFGWSAGEADAQITGIEITKRESPTFEGKSFGSVGTYEKLVGVAHGELDPENPRNAVITDIELAPRNARGNVEYSTNVYVLRPVDPAKRNGKLFYEANNRGGKLYQWFNESGGGNDPTTAADAGQGFLMQQGYTVAWSGWDPLAPRTATSLNIDVPVATNQDGSPITGPGYEYISKDPLPGLDTSPTAQAALTFPAATLDKSKAVLTRKRHLNDTPVVVPDDGWEYTSSAGTAIRLTGGPFEVSTIYEFSYPVKNPLVGGIGFAAVRDFVDFMKRPSRPHGGPHWPHRRASERARHGSRWKPPVSPPQTESDSSTLADSVGTVYAFAISQPARMLNDFQTLGFNLAEPGVRGERVFDGILNFIGGANGAMLNYRFGQTYRTERMRQHQSFPEGTFPFTYERTTDPFTGERAGRADRCRESDTCPKDLEVNSSNEYWSKAASLLHTDPLGRPLRDPENVRFYMLSGTQHIQAPSPLTRTICEQLTNPIDPNPPLRALFMRLDEWVSYGRKPPASRVPTPRDSAFIRPTAQGRGYVPADDLGWRSIPGVTYTGAATLRNLFDFGPEVDRGILSVNPPALTGSYYPAFVSRVDRDGNEIAGIRLPDVEVPTATATGWGIRAPEYAGPDGCENVGAWIPFAETEAERRASGDQRRSLEERYGSHSRYVRQVGRAAWKLERQGLLLPGDVRTYIAKAEESDVLR